MPGPGCIFRVRMYEKRRGVPGQEREVALSRLLQDGAKEFRRGWVKKEGNGEPRLEPAKK